MDHTLCWLLWLDTWIDRLKWERHKSFTEQNPRQFDCFNMAVQHLEFSRDNYIKHFDKEIENDL